MRLEISKAEIFEGVGRQLSGFFPVLQADKELLDKIGDEVLQRCEFCFEKSKNKYYTCDGETYFNPYHSAQYTIFLYYLSNSVYKSGNAGKLADKIYYLNKIMNACDLFYEIELPAIFMLDHPVGTVMGRATYGDYFSFGQNCTVGNNKGIYPTIGERVRMTANTMILGNSKIGNNVTLGTGACVKDQDVPDNTLVFGSSPNLIIKSLTV